MLGAVGLVKSPVRPTGTPTPVISSTPVSADSLSSDMVNAMTPTQRLLFLQHRATSPRSAGIKNQPSICTGVSGLTVAGIRPFGQQPIVLSAEACAALTAENQRLNQQVTELKQTVSDITADNLLMKKDALEFEATVLTLRSAMNGELGTTARLLAIKETVDRKLFSY